MVNQKEYIGNCWILFYFGPKTLSTASVTGPKFYKYLTLSVGGVACSKEGFAEVA